MHVLIVEDDSLIAGMLDRRVFRNHSTTIVSEVASALEALNTSHFDAVVTDWNLLDRDARPVADFCIENKIPFRVFSGAIPEDDLWRAGVWISKSTPFGLMDFCATLK